MSRRKDRKVYYTEIITSRGLHLISTGTTDLEAAKRFVAKLEVFGKKKVQKQ